MQRGPMLTRSPLTPADAVNISSNPNFASKTEIDNLSKQIESLLERGRKLRDAKPLPQTLNMTSSLTKPTINLSPISFTAPALTCSTSEDAISNIVALVDATDPIFSSDALKAPICTPSPTITPKKRPTAIDRSFPPVPGNPPSEACDLAVRRVCPASPRRDPESFAITLRQKSSKVSVEVWDKQSQSLVGLGLGDLSDSSIKCFDVWDDHPVATVTIATKLPSSQPSSRSVTPVISLQSSPCVCIEERPISARSNVGEFLTSRSIKESRRPPSARQSTESFLSFISASPVETEEPLVVSSGTDSEPESPVKVVPVVRMQSPVNRRPNIFDAYVEQLNNSLSSYDESLIIDKLNLDMKELDSLTLKLRGGAEIPQIFSPQKPSEPVASVSPKKISRRKKLGKRSSSRSALRRKSSQPPFTPIILESPLARNISVSSFPQPTQSSSVSRSSSCSQKSVFERNLHMVSNVACVSIEPQVVQLTLPPSLESLRKESIEQARRNILALKGSIISEVHSLEESWTPRN